MKYMKFLYCLLLLPVSIPALAQTTLTQWKIVPDKSSINFTATQNNAPVTGEFKVFTGNINVDPEKLAQSQVSITVDTHSVTTSYQQISDTLKTADWFNVTLFPKAIFKTDKIIFIQDNHYQANGTLTIRDKTIPVILNFNVTKIQPTMEQATGSTIIKRTAFGIGQGQWSKTDDIKDDVTVNFILTAVKK